MIRQRPGRSPIATTEHHHSLATTDDGTNRDASLSPQSRRQLVTARRRRSFVPIVWLYGTFHVLSLCVVGLGVYGTFTKLYTAQECDMTWSQRQFLPIQHAPFVWRKSTNAPPRYRLYKFMDQRDPRHQAFVQHGESTISSATANTHNATGWCLDHDDASTLGIVLYIPGHGGSFEQSRSLGAHGLQLTGRYSGNEREQQILRQLRRRVESPSDNRNIGFVYDVFTIDFGEEGGGFHSALLERQAAYVAFVIATLTETCRHWNGIHIVAHSIGGISARWALTMYPHATKSVRHLITLGTPHRQPVLSWEPGMLPLYQTLDTKESTSRLRQVAMVSISGGLRDEMIPPRSCRLDDNRDSSATLSLVATDIMVHSTNEGKSSTPFLGMDHRAIVWCHNLLSPVRSMLETLIRADRDGNDAPTRMQSLKDSLQHDTFSFDESYDYDSRVESMQQQLQVRSVAAFDR
jgi:pimeloyl-ACP methyl ester carboxylesterase